MMPCCACLNVLYFSSSSESASCILDYAKVRHGGSFHDSTVDEIKVVCKIFLVFASLVPYWIAYYQVCCITYCFVYAAFYLSEGGNVTVQMSCLNTLVNFHSNALNCAAVVEVYLIVLVVLCF